MTRMRMIPLLKSSQNGFTKGHLHSIWIKVLFSYLQLYITSIYCSLFLDGFTLAGVQGELKIGFYQAISRPQVDDGYIHIPLLQFVLQFIVPVMRCQGERGREKSEVFLPSYMHWGNFTAFCSTSEFPITWLLHYGFTASEQRAISAIQLNLCSDFETITL